MMSIDVFGISQQMELTVKGIEMVSFVVGGSVVVNDVNVTTSVTVSEVVAVLSDGMVSTEVTSTDDISYELCKHLKRSNFARLDH